MRALVLLLMATTAMASPRAGVEREVAPQTAGRHHRYYPKVANGFMIWTDHRAVSHTLAFGSPIEPSSKPFVPEGIPLFLNPSMESQADAVVAIDDGWVVAWREDMAGYARRIDASGAFVGSPVALYTGIYAPITISKAGRSLLFTTEANTDPALLTSFDLREVRRIELPQSFHFAITSSGDDHVIFFADRTAMRIAPDGIVETIKVNFPHRFVVAWTDRDYLLVYGVAGAIFARRLSTDLRTLGDEFRIVLPQGHAATNPSVRPAPTPGEAIVNWTEISGNCHTTIRTDNRVDTPLCLLGPPVGPLPPPPPPLRSFAAQLMFAAPRDGSDGPFLYVENDDFESRVTDGARAISPADRFGVMPAIATHDRGGLAVWMEQGPGTRNLAGRILGGSGDRFVIGPGTSEWMRWDWFTANFYSGSPSVVWSGQMYFVAWNAGSRLAHARVLENGTVLDTKLQAIDPIHWGDGQTNPVATRVGDKILLVWTEGSRGGCGIACSDLPAKIRAARFTLDGQLIDTRIIADEPYSTFADVTTNGDMALIAWQHEQRIYVRRMTSSGFVFETTRFLVAEGTRPSVARHGDGFVVAWQSPTTARGERHHTIHAALISRDGVAGEPFLIANETWQSNGPFAWTMPDGSAAIAYGRRSHGSGLVPRLYYRSITNDASSRTRAVRR